MGEVKGSIPFRAYHLAWHAPRPWFDAQCAVFGRLDLVEA